MKAFSIRNILILAFIARTLIAAIALRDSYIPIEPDDYLKIGLRTIENHFFDFEVFPPLYILFCGILNYLFHEYAVFAVVLTQVVISTASVILTERLALKAFGSKKISLVAAMMVAIDPTLILQTSFVLTETFYVFFFLCFAHLFTSAISLSNLNSKKSLVLLSISGVLLGIACLTRSVGIVLVPASLLILMITHLKSSRWILPSILFFATFQASIAPWCFRNLRQWGHYAISSSGDQNFAALFVGVAKMRAENKPLIAGFDSWNLDTPLTEQTSQNPFLFAKAYSTQAKKWLIENPVRFVKGFIIGQINLFFGPYQAGWAQVFYGEDGARQIPLPALIVLAGWRFLLFIFTILGIWMSRSAGNKRVVMYLFMCGIFHALATGSGGNARFLTPAIPMMAIFASIFVASKFKTFKD